MLPNTLQKSTVLLLFDLTVVLWALKSTNKIRNEFERHEAIKRLSPRLGMLGQEIFDQGSRISCPRPGSALLYQFDFGLTLANIFTY